MESGLACLTIHNCRLMTEGGRLRACLVLHPAVDPSARTLPKPIRTYRCYRHCECDYTWLRVDLTKETNCQFFL